MLSQRACNSLRIIPRFHSAKSSLWSRALFTSSVISADAVKLRDGEDYFSKNERLKRPMSPHLTIYKPQLTSMLSIAHRGTGVMLSSILSGFSIGMLMVPGSFPYYLVMVESMNYGSFLIFTAKLAVTFPFMFHICNGMRHLAWDAGLGFNLKVLYQSGYAVVGVASILAVIVSSL